MTRTAASQQWQRPGWRPVLFALSLVLGAVLLAYRDTGLAMVAIWARSDTFAHAFLVPPIVAWLIWRKRGELAVCSPRPAAWMLLPIGVSSFAWLIGDLAASNAVAQLAFTALLVSVVIAVIGVRTSRVIAFPLAFLFFSVPIGEFVLPQMMQWTADFTVLALRLSGIPVYREGLQFVVPSGNWSVVEACSGIRYLIASVMVGTLFAYLNYRTLRRRLIFTGVAIVVPIIANWVRAYLIVLIGNLSGNAAAVSADHLIYGWVFFGIVITVMFMIGARWSETAAPPSAPPPLPTPPNTGLRRSAPAMGIAIAAVLLLLTPHLLLDGMLRAEKPGTPDLRLPITFASGWKLVAGANPGWAPGYKRAASEINAWYSEGGPQVGLYVGYYRHQDFARKMVSSENRVVTLHNPDWSGVGEGSRSISVDGEQRVFQTTLLRASSHIANANSERLQVWRIFWIDGVLTADENRAKLIIALRKLMWRGDDAAVIMVYSRGSDGDPDDPLLASFVQKNLGALTHSLALTRDPLESPLADASPKEVPR